MSGVVYRPMGTWGDPRGAPSGDPACTCEALQLDAKVRWASRVFSQAHVRGSRLHLFIYNYVLLWVLFGIEPGLRSQATFALRMGAPWST